MVASEQQREDGAAARDQWLAGKSTAMFPSGSFYIKRASPPT
ncbi:MAG: hypothetical protein ACXW0G_04240 [Methylosarcina sp.]